MKTEQEIKEKLEYMQGSKDALSGYLDKIICSSVDDDIVELTGQIKALKWVLEVDNGNK